MEMDERTSSVGPAEIMATACRQTRPDATRETPAVVITKDQPVTRGEDAAGGIGRYAEERAKKQGKKKPGTFDFLGLRTQPEREVRRACANDAQEAPQEPHDGRRMVPKRARSWKRRTQPRETHSLSGLLYSERWRFFANDLLLGYRFSRVMRVQNSAS